MLQNFRSEILIILTLILIFFIATNIYKKITHFNVIARFLEIGPISKGMSVYYKGYKVGNVLEIQPSKDFKYMLVKLSILTRYRNLANNVSAKVKNLDGANRQYIEIIYPDSPNKETLKEGSLIVGTTPPDIKSFIEKQAESGQLDIFTADLKSAMSNLKSTSQKTDKMLDLMTSIVIENRKDIRRTINNTAQTTQNIEESTGSLKDYIADKQMKKNIREIAYSSASLVKNLDGIVANLKDITGDEELKATSINIRESSENIKKTTENIKAASKNIENTTKSIDEATKGLPRTSQNIDGLIIDARSALCQINHLALGVSEMLGKRFLIPKLVFGKPGKELGQKTNCTCNK